jgi:hypothetical protein
MEETMVFDVSFEVRKNEMKNGICLGFCFDFLS